MSTGMQNYGSALATRVLTAYKTQRNEQQQENR